jgi:hypothetical protein
MTWESGPALKWAEDGSAIAHGYRITKDEADAGGPWQATTLVELHPIEVKWGCKAKITADCCPDLMALVFAQRVQRDTIMRAWHLGQERLAALGQPHESLDEDHPAPA